MNGYQPRARKGPPPNPPSGGGGVMDTPPVRVTVYSESVERGNPVLRNRLIRKMAASYIRHQLFIGTKAREIGLEIEGNDLGETRFQPVGDTRQISMTILGVTGTGPTIDAALRHWCELVEGDQ